MTDEFDDKKREKTQIIVGRRQKWIDVSHLRQCKGSFKVSKAAKPDITVELLAEVSLNPTASLCFALGGEIIRIAVKPGRPSIRIIVGRAPNELNSVPSIEELEQKWGKRVARLLLAAPTLSAPKGIDKPGHFVVDIGRPNVVHLADLGSTNGTHMNTLTEKQCFDILSSWDATGVSDPEENWVLKMSGFKLDLMPVVSNIVYPAKRPTLIYVPKAPLFVVD